MMIDHAAGSGTVLRSHDLSLHVNNTAGPARTASASGIPPALTNGAGTGPHGPPFSQLRAVTSGAPVIAREATLTNAVQTPQFAAAIEPAGRRKLVISGLLTKGRVPGTALAGLERGHEVHLTADAAAGETLETHQAAVQRTTQAGALPATWLSLASHYQESHANHQPTPGSPGLMTQHSPALRMLFHGQPARQATPAASPPAP